MGSTPAFICPKCKSSDWVKRVTEIHEHYQNKESVKKFFGEEMVEIPDYLKDSVKALEILDRKGEFELTQGQASIPDDGTMEGMTFDAESYGGTHQAVVLKHKRDLEMGDIAPPREPVIAKVPLALGGFVLVGGTMVATYLAAAAIGITLAHANSLLIAGCGILFAGGFVFVGIMLKNNRILTQYEKEMNAWRHTFFCNRCQRLFLIEGVQAGGNG